VSALAVPSAYTGCRIAARYDGYRVPRLPLIEKGNQAPSPSGGLGWVLGVLGWVFSCTVMGVRCVQWWVLAVLNLAFTFSRTNIQSCRPISPQTCLLWPQAPRVLSAYNAKWGLPACAAARL
jgi:hypothetical protein